jgi:membrane-associated protein
VAVGASRPDIEPGIQAGAGPQGAKRAGPVLWGGVIPAHVALLPGWLSPPNLIDALGSWAVIGIALIIFAECGILLGFFLPGDTLLFVSGLLIASAAAGDAGIQIHVAWFILIVTAAAFIGNLVGYWIGRAAGPKVFHRKDARFLKPEYVDKSERFFQRFGPLTVMVARFVPIVRTVATVMAGVGRMNARLFALYSAIGGAVWVAVVTIAGYYLGQIEFVKENVDLIFVAAAVIVIGFSVVPAVLHWRQKRSAASAVTKP